MHKTQKILRLLIGVFCIGFFIFGIAPLLLKNQASMEMKQFIEEENIDANALFYTESPKAGEVEFYFKKHQLPQ